MKISRGTPYQLSSRGYYNFFYPDGTTHYTLQEMEGNPMNWLGGNGLRPMMINANTLIDEHLGKGNVVIWVDDTRAR